MKYELLPAPAQNQRQQLNDAVLALLAKNEITGQEAFAAYTGGGGLHGLNFNDFEHFAAFTAAKKEIELGQFFTPYKVQEKIVSCLQIGNSDKVADFCCGVAGWANFLPKESNFFGLEFDTDIYKVSKFLYPSAEIKQGDFQYFKPAAGVAWDFILSNPPFNLTWLDGANEWRSTNSQALYFRNTANWLEPFGIAVYIVPCKFLDDTFLHGTTIQAMEHLNFIGQAILPKGTFDGVGIDIKIMAWQKVPNRSQVKPFTTDKTALQNFWLDLASAATLRQVEMKQVFRQRNKKATLEKSWSFSNPTKGTGFEFKVSKFLYEIKQHQPKHLQKALAKVQAYKEQEKPAGMDDKAWEQRKITDTSVIKFLKSCFCHTPARNQETPAIKGGRTIRHFVGENTVKSSIVSLVTRQNQPYDLGQFAKVINLKKADMNLQMLPFDKVAPSVEVQYFLKDFTFANTKGEFHFTKIQQADISKIITKKRSILNWEMGCGKTAATYAVAKYRLKKQGCNRVIIVAPALATELTWDAFLSQQSESFAYCKTPKQIQQAKATFLLISFEMVTKHYKHLAKLVKMENCKVQVIIDEADEICNQSSKRFKATFAGLSKAKYKLLATGTTTRNNLTEIYTLLNFLYRNSYNFISTSENWYYQDKDGDIMKAKNPTWLKPFPMRGGFEAFKCCFNPAKKTVFGITKQNQDIYNGDCFLRLVEYSVQTRLFAEIAGEKYQVTSTLIDPTFAEVQVYKTIINDFHQIVRTYFASTGNSRKEAALKVVRQMQLLIKACSLPNHFAGCQNNSKLETILNDVAANPSQQICIGCTSLDAAEMYFNAVKAAGRECWLITGAENFKNRETKIKDFEACTNGVLVCTQQSLKSSVNIPSCNLVFIESLQWNNPRMAQFYFRFIRFNSTELTTVRFYCIKGSIEQNLLALVADKQRLNDFIRLREYVGKDEALDKLGVDSTILQNVLLWGKDGDGANVLAWGNAQ
jgi:hypothetical protein